ncbi:MAG: radical SAM family heme chaperone HemW [Clostridia bacterium]|nr:radical SAM family heme chaperone HemW [Clostridia bacterium]
MELYIHLPFCKSKCRYCDFASYAGCEKHMTSYVEALLTEAETAARELPTREIETVFIGGGTPSLLPADLLELLLSGIHHTFELPRGIEFTTEANPGTLTMPWLETAVKYGVNRLSMGMQAFQPELLKTLGRIHSFDQVKESVNMARSTGISNISLDLMFGLPGQSIEHWRETLRAALSLQPQHLSCYGLIPEENTPLKADLDAGRLILPDEEDERIMYDEAIDLLSVNGYEQYEISNFARPGFACHHNLGYWRQIPYLGLGASASSMLPTTSGKAVYLRQTNPPGLQEYMQMVKSENWSRRETIAVTRDDAKFETMMLGLRTTQGISELAFDEMHGISLNACYGAKLADLEKRGLVCSQSGFWRLTRRGMDVQNAILVELMDE